MFCGTYQTYCSALPSSNPTWLKQTCPGGKTAEPVRKETGRLRGSIESGGGIEYMLPVLGPVPEFSRDHEIV